jgi:ABC-type metal ion transport system substrate-binding protein
MEENLHNIQDKVQLNKFLNLCFQLNINIFQKYKYLLDAIKIQWILPNVDTG